MMLVALTGGIGAGKSAVSSRLAARGAVIVDADGIVRQLQVPGAPLLTELAARFGEQIILADGSLDRAGLAAIAFKDDESVAALNAIMHPAVRAEIRRQIDAERDTDRIVVLDTPLMTETVVRGLVFAAIIVVDTPIELAVERLVAQRGMSAEDALARISKQISREERVAGADIVIDNGGDVADLDVRVDELWSRLQDLRDAGSAALTS
jgi:dephospho-CoA kinase